MISAMEGVRLTRNYSSHPIVMSGGLPYPADPTDTAETDTADPIASPGDRSPYHLIYKEDIRMAVSHPRKLALATGFSLLAAFGTVASAAPVTIVHYGYPAHGAAWREFTRMAAAEFMAQNPGIKIEITEAGSSSEYINKFTAMFVAGQSPDIIEVTMSGASYAQEGFFLDLKPFIDRDPDVSADLWPKPVIDGFTLDGRIWGLPIDINLWMNWYNVDLFEEAGLLDPNALGEKWDWDNMVQAAKKLTTDKNGDGSAETYGVDRAYLLWQYALAVAQSGGRMFDRFLLPTESRLNTPEVKRALQFVADLYLKHKVSQPRDMAWDTLSKYFFWTGNSALDLVDGPGIMGAQLKSVKFRWDVAKPMKGPGGRGTHFTVGGFQISSGSKNPEAAWKWVKYLTARKESVEKFVKLTGRLPALRSVQPLYKTLLPNAPEHTNVIFEVAAAPTTYPQYVVPVPNTGARNTIMNPVLLGQMDVSTALEQAHEETQNAFKAYFEQKAKSSSK